jgi:hypothetical protein
MLEREEENDKGNIGSRANLPTGQCGQLPSIISFLQILFIQRFPNFYSLRPHTIPHEPRPLSSE